MIFIADECTHGPVVARLRSDGHTVHWIMETAPGTVDAAILSLGENLGVPVITAATDFGELVYRDGQGTRGVILLRLEGISNALRAEIVSRFVREYEARIPGAFIVVRPGDVRVRTVRDARR